MAEYDWLIPRGRIMRALYDATENRPVRYALTWPLWFARYHWLAHRARAASR